MSKITDPIEAKKKHIASLLDLGLSSEDAHICYDMVQCSKVEMMDKIKEVADRAPHHLRTLILSMVLDCIYQMGQDEQCNRNLEAMTFQGVVNALMGSELRKQG
jgi:hypothetical protein